MPNIQYFTPDLSVGTYANSTANAVALPNTADSLLYIVNQGPLHVAFQLGTTANAAKAGLTPSTGMVVCAGQSLIVGTTGMGWIAMIGLGSQGNASTVNLTSGN